MVESFQGFLSPCLFHEYSKSKNPDKIVNINLMQNFKLGAWWSLVKSFYGRECYSQKFASHSLNLQMCIQQINPFTWRSLFVTFELVLLKISHGKTFHIFHLMAWTKLLWSFFSFSFIRIYVISNNVLLGFLFFFGCCLRSNSASSQNKRLVKKKPLRRRSLALIHLRLFFMCRNNNSWWEKFLATKQR